MCIVARKGLMNGPILNILYMGLQTQRNTHQVMCIILTLLTNSFFSLTCGRPFKKYIYSLDPLICFFMYNVEINGIPQKLFIPMQINYFPLKYCHMSCSHLSLPSCIRHGNHILAHVKMKQGTLYDNEVTLDFGFNFSYIYIYIYGQGCERDSTHM